MEETKNERFLDNMVTDSKDNQKKSKFSTSYLEKINSEALSRYEKVESKANLNTNQKHRLEKVQMKMK